MKVVDATYEIPGMTREEAERFLETKLNLQIATILAKIYSACPVLWHQKALVGFEG